MKRFSFGLVTGLIIGLLITSTYAFANPNIKLIINGKEIICDTPPQNINGRVLVPARFVAEPLGAIVTWDSADNAVLIASKPGSGSVPTPTISREESEKQEFLAISKKVEAAIEKYDAEMEKTVTDKDYDVFKADIDNLLNELASWGQLYPYTSIKRLYVEAITNISVAYVNKTMVDSPYSTSEFESEYKKYKGLIKLDISSIEAEKTRLQKLGYL